MQSSFKFQLPTHIDTIGVVERFIEDTHPFWKISEEVYGNIMVAVSEAINNAIFHGNKLDKNKLIHFEVNCVPEEIVFTVSDEGSGFNYDNLPDPTAPERLMEPGGRGVFLMRALADEVTFENSGKTVILTFETHQQTVTT